MATTSLQACADCPAPPSASDSGVHSGVRRGDQGPPPRPAPAQSTSAVKQDDVLDPSTFEPPQLNQGEDGEELPRVVIEFCDRCRWLHRATWTQTELFLTFPPPALHSITLVPRNAPETGGRFRVWLLRYRSLEQEYDDTVGKGKERWNGWELVWDRKIERGFPEMKDLKQRIRNIIAPSQDLGHSDKPVKAKPAAVVNDTPSAPASDNPRPAAPAQATKPCFACTLKTPAMRLEQIKEELVVLQSSLTQEGEIRMEGDEEWAQWEPVLADASPVTSSLPLPTLSLRLAPDVHLAVEYLAGDELPDFSLHCLTLGRGEQARLRAELESAVEQVQGEDSQLPVFTVFTALQEYLAANPPQAVASRAASAEAEAPRAPQAGPFQLKTTLLWSHHLLATSKRKDIVAWSTELSLYGLSKPGYPGVIIVEGLASNVDEFVHRIKQLQWKALQVRCELGGALIDAQAVEEAGLGVRDAPVWVVRRRSHLGPVLDPKGADKVCVREVEGLNEVGEIMRAAGLEDVFLTALKLNK